MVDNTKVAIAGAAVGVSTPWIMSHAVMPVLNWLAQYTPSATIKLATPATITADVRGSLTGIDGSFTKYLLDLTGISISIPGSTYIMAAISGAILFVIGYMVADAIGLLSGNGFKKMTTVIFTGSFLAWLLFTVGVKNIATTFGFTTINILLAFLINAAMISGLFWVINKYTPFPKFTEI